ncbi:ABC transporter substrate-binding protein [Halostreptopolyspora alba]|uniref:Iron-siderophore ABC transporter substrate-binding protein n=1 Tax=Halostreptopolyspora alba TaxID=2487137 RepID=A0A3N0DYC4_9ACTN|nr:iron-siderophore ABC transporter substrate-binding protein [Nocardiopsaceae bacterium YIM 96095]
MLRTVHPPRPLARPLLAVGAAGVLALVSACGSGDTEEAADTGGGEFPITVEHFRGTTEIESPPETVVALDSSYVDAAVSLELDVVGRVVNTEGEELPDYLGDEARTYAGDAEVVGLLEEPDLAAIAELEPDLIVSADVRHQDIYDQLSEIAPTVFSETTGATWKDNIRLLAEATGRQDLAEQRIGAYEERAEELGSAITEANGGEAPTLSITRFVGEPSVRLYSSASFPGLVQQDVGLPRPEGAPDAEDEIMVDLSEEEVLDVDADHIVVGVWDDGNGESEEVAADFRSNPLWEQLEGEQHDVSDEIWFTSVSLQGAEGILDDLAEIHGVDEE